MAGIYFQPPRKWTINSSINTDIHANILAYIFQFLNKDKYKSFIDITGHLTLSSSLVVTTLEPDIVILDQKSKAVSMYLKV